MRDLKLFYDEGFDIDVDSQFNPVYVDYANQTQDQRAAVAVAISRGTIPGALDIGTDWSALYTADSSSQDQGVVSLYDSAKQMISQCAGNDDNISQQYLPLLERDEETGKFTIRTLKGGVTQ